MNQSFESSGQEKTPDQEKQEQLYTSYERIKNLASKFMTPGSAEDVQKMLATIEGIQTALDEAKDGLAHFEQKFSGGN